MTCSHTTRFSSLSSLLPPTCSAPFLLSFVVRLPRHCCPSPTPSPIRVCRSINFPLFLLLLLRLRWRDYYLSLSTTEHGFQLDIKFISLSIHFSRPLFFSLFFSLPRTFDLGAVWTCLAPFHGLLLKVASSQSETCTSDFCQIFYLYISFSLRCFRY